MQVSSMVAGFLLECHISSTVADANCHDGIVFCWNWFALWHTYPPSRTSSLEPTLLFPSFVPLMHPLHTSHRKVTEWITWPYLHVRIMELILTWKNLELHHLNIASEISMPRLRRS